MRRAYYGLASLFLFSAAMIAAVGCDQASKAETKAAPAVSADAAAAPGEAAAPAEETKVEEPAAETKKPEEPAKKADESAKSSDATDATDSFESFAKSLSKDLQEKLSLAQEGKEVDFAPIVKRLTDRMASSSDVSTVGAAAQLAGVLEMFSPAETVKPLYEAMNKFADRVAADNPKLAAEVHEVTKTGLARLNLVGTKPKIEGATVDGTKFDLSKYEGKVVLLDFWATWCGPCKAELPNVKKVYEKYHEKGFEVVSISLDDDAKTLSEFLEKEKLPWITLFPTGTDRGFENPLAKEFMVQGIPATFLIDRTGKLASISARGERLALQVEKLLKK